MLNQDELEMIPDLVSVLAAESGAKVPVTVKIAQMVHINVIVSSNWISNMVKIL